VELEVLQVQTLLPALLAVLAVPVVLEALPAF
jgi:hypothetical protein